MMSRSEGVGNGVGARRKMSQVNRSNNNNNNNNNKQGPDEDLLLFREMRKREKDVHLSLLQPISVEFEANGNNAVYRVGSGKRSSGPAGGVGFLAENGKNDYDWLKTPPATPLFPSLEMEAAAAEEQQLVVQREIPVFQPLISRFADNNPSSETTTVRITSSTHHHQRPNSPNSSKPKHPSVIRYQTKTSWSDHHKKNIKSSTSAAVTSVMNLKKMNLCRTDDGIEILSASSSTSSGKRVHQKESRPCNYQATSNLSKSVGVVDSSSSTSTTKPTTRGVSPPVRSKIMISSQIPAGSDSDSTAPPPNLKTDRRSLSATRGRSSGDQNRPVAQKQLEAGSLKAVIRRQSCSPSVTRGRKLIETATDHLQRNTTALLQRSAGGVQQTANTNRSSSSSSSAAAQIAGSRMVDKLLNARNHNMSSSAHHHQERKIINKTTKPLDGSSSTNESSGFGRAVSKSSLDMALKHMDFRRYSVNMQPTYPRHSSTGSSNIQLRNP